jgi:hypothetical protein
MSGGHDDDDITLADPRELYSLDEVIATDDLLDDVISEAEVLVKGTVEALEEEASDHRLRLRTYIKRPCEEYHRQLMDDYFSENPIYPPHIFRRRFRMSRPLFLRIVEELGNCLITSLQGWMPSVEKALTTTKV